MYYLKICLTLLSSVFIFSSADKKLKQVLILSRHNVRTPLAKNLAQLTPNTWPMWSEKPGYLTNKGFELEGYMGGFFSTWLREEELLTEECPSKDNLYVYANVKQRTMKSAEAFIEKGFPGCPITIHHSPNNTDPLFNPFIHNTSSIFKQLALEQMERRLKSMTDIKDSYKEIETILDYKNSELCKTEKRCDLSVDKNTIIDVDPGSKPGIAGPLKLSSSSIDAFVMEYYEGIPMEEVAWGKLNAERWDVIMKLSRGYHNVIFNTTLIAEDIAAPLLKFISDTFLSKNSSKVTLLMGHDANLYTVIKSLKFKPYVLKNQHEITPVGGKLVFQKWYDGAKDVNYLKVEYVYQTMEQMRFGAILNLENPPQFQLMQIDGCKININGFCKWEDFVKILEKM